VSVTGPEPRERVRGFPGWCPCPRTIETARTLAQRPSAAERVEDHIEVLVDRCAAEARRLKQRDRRGPRAPPRGAVAAPLVSVTATKSTGSIGTPRSSPGGRAAATPHRPAPRRRRNRAARRSLATAPTRIPCPDRILSDALREISSAGTPCTPSPCVHVNEFTVHIGLRRKPSFRATNRATTEINRSDWPPRWPPVKDDRPSPGPAPIAAELNATSRTTLLNMLACVVTAEHDKR
jgi:hypothetical protein